MRALLGTLVAGMLAAVALRMGLAHTRVARRVLVLGPVLTAAVAGAAVAFGGEAYLPQVWVTSRTTGTAGQLLELLGDWRVQRHLELVVLAYAATVALLSVRRLVGTLALRRLLRRAVRVGEGPLYELLDRLAVRFGIATPTLFLLAPCPGGAFTAGLRHPLIAVDPALLAELDERETEALLAHELAHVARRDPLVGLAVGIVRDFAFFVPPVHLAARWLRAEQEEGADELASACTRRPAALASTILKVWDATRGRAVPRSACAAVASSGIARWEADGMSAAARLVTVRVERLVACAPVLGRPRQACELALALMVLGVAFTTALVVPGHLARAYNAYSLSFAYVTKTSDAPVESPAFATFRALAPAPATVRASAEPIVLPPPRPSTAETCPCVETQAQLLAGSGPDAVAAPVMQWRMTDEDPWQARDNTVHARPLWTLSDTGPHVGFFVVSDAS